jgi:hypothetical protein
MRDGARLADAPVEGYRTFIDEFVARIGEMGQLLRYAKGTVELDPVVLHIDADDRLMSRITAQLKALPTH